MPSKHHCHRFCCTYCTADLTGPLCWLDRVTLELLLLDPTLLDELLLERLLLFDPMLAKVEMGGTITL